MANMTTQEILQGIKDWAAPKVIYDISAAHNNTKYTGLSDALGTNGGNIPQEYRKGGITVRYVQSSDNKYIRYNLLATSFTTDTTQWAVDDAGVYVECPEYVAVYADADGKIILAVENDGNIHFGAGVPQQVIDYINEKIAELSLDEYEDIVAFLNDLEKGDKTLQTLLDEKVGKEEGKSLIDKEYADGVYHIENPEFAGVWLDGEDKILFGIKTDGEPYFGVGCPKQIKQYIEEKIAELSLDELITGIQAQLTTKVDKEEGKSLIDAEYASSQSAVDNPEYIEAKTDSEGKLLAGRTPDGAAFENVGFATPKVSIDGATIENIEDLEGRHEVTIDSENKIINYRKDDGTLVENAGIETNHLELTEQGMTEFQQALKDAGFKGGTGDWSDSKSLSIQIPRCAMVNIVNPNGTTVFPQTKESDYHYLMEFFDMQGNYFKKEIIMNAQGRSSLAYDKKNGAIDICNNNGWDDDDTFKIKFGNWVSQDSFHIKAYPSDFFKGVGVISYNLADLIWKTRGIEADRPWKKALIDFSTIGSGYSTSTDIDDMSLQMDNGARCIPDGFPCMVYLDGSFYGLYSWQLKKHRDNYHMKKDNKKHIHLDGNIGWSTLFGANGNSANINWNPYTWYGFEIRNPKDIWTMEGKKYDADLNLRQEPVDSVTAENWISAGVLPDGKEVTSKIAKQLRNSYGVRESIIDLSTVIPDLINLRDNGGTTEQIRAKFEEYFDVDNVIDYVLFSCVIFNYDGFYGNWQYTTWNGKKWFICPYDCDSTFGNMPEGTYIKDCDVTLIEDTISACGNLNNPSGWVVNYYVSEMKARWRELKENGTISLKTIESLAVEWMNRIGENYYKEEYNKWPDSPCNRDSNLDTTHWSFEMSNTSNPPSGSIYNNSTTYNEGDVVYYKVGSDTLYNKYSAKVETLGNPPILPDKVYDGYPSSLGHHDNIYRLLNSYTHIVEVFDTYINSL